MHHSRLWLWLWLWGGGGGGGGVGGRGGGLGHVNEKMPHVKSNEKLAKLPLYDVMLLQMGARVGCDLGALQPTADGLLAWRAYALPRLPCLNPLYVRSFRKQDLGTQIAIVSIPAVCCALQDSYTGHIQRPHPRFGVLTSPFALFSAERKAI